MFNFTELIDTFNVGDGENQVPYSKALDFLSKITPIEIYTEKKCWLWKGAPNKNGYGQIYCNRKLMPKLPSGQFVKNSQIAVHRFAWWLFKFEFPKDIYIIHNEKYCKNRLCVNPHHLLSYSANRNKFSTSHFSSSSLSHPPSPFSPILNRKIIHAGDSINNVTPSIEELMELADYWRYELQSFPTNNKLHLSIILDMGDHRDKIVDSPDPFASASKESASPNSSEAEEVDFGD